MDINCSRTAINLQLWFSGRVLRLGARPRLNKCTALEGTSDAVLVPEQWVQNSLTGRDILPRSSAWFAAVSDGGETKMLVYFYLGAH